MDVESACDLINGMIYKPEWKIEAEDFTKRFEDTIRVTITYPAIDTDKDKAKDGYQVLITTYARFPVIVGDCDTDVLLYRRVIDAILEIDAHEAREALRTSAFIAPFHPHRIDGMRNWETTAPTDVDRACRPDLQFGIA